MTRYDAVLFAISTLGAFNALLVSALWLAPGRRSILPDFWPYPAITALSGMIILLIGGDHSGVILRLSALEWLLTAFSGPLMLDAVRRGVGLPGLRWSYLSGPVIFIGAIYLSSRTGWPEIWMLMVCQWAFTAIAALSWFGAKELQPARRAAFVLLAIFVTVHVAQLIRVWMPGTFRDLVPLSLAVAFLFLTSFLLLRSRALGNWFRQLDRQDAAGPALQRLQEWLAESKAYRSADLRLSDAAKAIGVPSEDLSKWLNDRKQPFVRLVSEARLADAARKLTAPEEARTSVEAIGLLVGFKSRSGFYKAFKLKYGMTPAQYRRGQSAFLSARR